MPNANLTILPSTLKRIGLQAITYIMENTNKGIDKDGKVFEEYSKKPFAMPSGSLYSYLGPAGYRRFMKANSSSDNEEITDDIKFFKKGGSVWTVIENGYLSLRLARFGSSGSNVNLQVRGNRGGMLGSMQIINYDSESVTIGFSNAEASRLASYHTLLGAGKSKKIRNFLGVTKEQEEELAKMLTKGITINFT